MSIARAHRGLPVALAVASIIGSATSAFGQGSGSPPSDLEKEVSAVKAENEALREQVRKIEEQQRALLDLINQLQRRLDGPQTAAAATASVPATSAGIASTQPASVEKQDKEDPPGRPRSSSPETLAGDSTRP